MLPVYFSDATASYTTGSDFMSLFAYAEDAWLKAGVGLVPLPAITMADAAHYSAAISCTTSQLRGAATSFALFDWRLHPFAVEVFFCAHYDQYDWDGGAHLYGVGTGDARAILTDDIDPNWNTQILAHELGHALSLLHPTQLGRSASHGTIMCTGSIPESSTSMVYLDPPELNSEHNAALVSNPLLYGSLVRAPNANPDCVHSDCGDCE